MIFIITNAFIKLFFSIFDTRLCLFNFFSCTLDDLCNEEDIYVSFSNSLSQGSAVQGFCSDSDEAMFFLASFFVIMSIIVIGIYFIMSPIDAVSGIKRMSGSLIILLTIAVISGALYMAFRAFCGI